MQISYSYGSNTNFSPIEVSSIKEVAELALTNNVSTGVYKNNYRKLDNFIKADFIGLDVDNGMTIDQAKLVFQDYAHAILPTRNHRKEKNGEVADRFRVFLQLEEPITNEKDFYQTWFDLAKLFPAIDPAAKDPSRQFYKSSAIEQIKDVGKKIKISRWVEKDKTVDFSGIKGNLGRETLEFLTFGAQTGGRNNALYKACRDLYQNNYNEEEVRGLVTPVGIRIGLDEIEIDSTIASAFVREPKHEARVEESSFNPITIDQLVNKKTIKIDWLVDGLLPKGAVSLIAGPPKAGKSTIIRQLSTNVAMGDKKFLKRNVKQGRVLYMALEEQEEVLKNEYKNLGVTGNNLFIHVGGINKSEINKGFKKFIIDNQIDLVVIDTLILFAEMENSNDYNDAYKAVSVIRDLARETKAHFLVVHHTNKSEATGTNSIMGSNAILGAVDIAILFKAYGERRYIQSIQRSGNPFTGEELTYNKDENTYNLGSKNKKVEESREF